MPNQEPEAITLRFLLSALYAESEDVSSIEEDDDFQSTCSTAVIKPGGSHLRLSEPLSPTPFGSFGPMLDLGDVIEVIPLDDGTYRYIGLTQQTKPWTWFAEATAQATEQDDAHQIPDRIIELGGMCVWVNHVFRIQIPRNEVHVDIPGNIKKLLEDLRRVLIEGEKLPERSGDLPRNTTQNQILLRKRWIHDGCYLGA